MISRAPSRRYSRPAATRRIRRLYSLARCFDAPAAWSSYAPGRPGGAAAERSHFRAFAPSSIRASARSILRTFDRTGSGSGISHYHLRVCHRLHEPSDRAGGFDRHACFTRRPNRHERTFTAAETMSPRRDSPPRAGRAPRFVAAFLHMPLRSTAGRGGIRHSSTGTARKVFADSYWNVCACSVV